VPTGPDEYACEPSTNTQDHEPKNVQFAAYVAGARLHCTYCTAEVQSSKYAELIPEGTARHESRCTEGFAFPCIPDVRVIFYGNRFPRALFSSENFWEIDTVALSFVFDKYYPIID